MYFFVRNLISYNFISLRFNLQSLRRAQKRINADYVHVKYDQKNIGFSRRNKVHSVVAGYPSHTNVLDGIAPEISITKYQPVLSYGIDCTS